MLFEHRGNEMVFYELRWSVPLHVSWVPSHSETRPNISDEKTWRLKRNSLHYSQRYLKISKVS
jgi:hypothetical protein